MMNHMNITEIWKWAITLLFFITGCTQAEMNIGDESGDDGSEGEASLTIEIGQTASRSAKDGDVMKNLTLLVVNSENKIAYRYESKPDAPTATISIKDILRGHYTLYFVANAPEDLNLYPDFVAHETLLPDSFYNTLLKECTGTDTPSYNDTQGMPLTLKTSIFLAPKANKISVELERVVGQYSITVFNHITSKKLGIHLVKLSNFNPSTGYLFNHENAIPASVDYRMFTSMTEAKIMQPLGESLVFEQYFYENKAPIYELALGGSIFNDDDPDPVKYDVTRKIENNQIQIDDASKIFFIRSNNTNSYMCMDGSGNLLVNELTDDELSKNANIQNYLWQFSGTSSGKIQNVGTGHYIASSGTTLQQTASAAKAEVFTFNKYNGYFYMRTTYNNQHYYLTCSNNSITLTLGHWYYPNTNEQLWQLRTFSETWKWLDANNNEIKSVKDFLISTPINFINSYGAAEPLRYIYRNERVHTIVNVFYNDAYETLKFEVVPWIRKYAETSFD